LRLHRSFAALALATVLGPLLPAHSARAVSLAPPDELGRVPVLEYHRFGDREGRWTRTYEHFRQDLEYLWRHGYVTVNARDLAAGRLDVPTGRKPVVLTFDDATAEQFKFLHDARGQVRRDASGKPLVDPRSAVGIMDAMFAAHPDFGRAGTFFVLPEAFEVPGESREKLRVLVETGREVANHTVRHDSCRKLSTPAIIREMSGAQTVVQAHLGATFRFATLALPFGEYPRSPEGKEAVVAGPGYRHQAVFLVGADPAPSPFDRAYDARRVPRIQAIDSEWSRHFHRGAGDREAFRPFVSDGDASTVAFPPARRERLDRGRLGTRHVVELPVGGGGGPVPRPVATDPHVVVTPAGVNVHPGYGQAALPPGGSYLDGKIFHVVQAGQTPTTLANAYLRFTDVYTRPSLERELLRKNGLRNWIPVGRRLEIPYVRRTAVVPRSRQTPADFEARGIYVTKTSAGTDRVFSLVREMKPHGLNTVVFDIKDMDGHLAIDSRQPLANASGSDRQAIIRDLPKLVDRLHRDDLHVVARIACFHDAFLATHQPRLALRSKHGGPWREKGKLVWLDPAHPEVRGYLIGLAKEVVAAGVDEVQFDYIRFPAMGDMKAIAYSFDPVKRPKDTVITSFLKEAYETLHPLGVLVSMDCFGVVAWDAGVDVKNTGQRLEDLGQWVDAMSPMVYPSHFYPPYLGHRWPADEPYFFVNEGVKRTATKMGPGRAVVRPWLQAFRYMVHGYGPDYVKTQIVAARDASASGYLLWNAGNEYGVALQGVARARTL
jgi:peptidoglycan/xylan/chitin deacetylase (PgdA/CDA1 family)